MQLDQKWEWRRTSFQRLNGTIETAHDDWTLSDRSGDPLARIYRYAFGPNAGLWSWFVLGPCDGASSDDVTGIVTSGREAREACEARVLIARGGAEPAARDQRARALSEGERR